MSQRQRPASVDAVLAKRARTRNGMVTFDEATAASLSRAQRYRRIRDRGWQRPEPGVLVLPGAMPTWELDALVALESCSGVLSHGAAARVLGLEGFAASAVHISIDGHRRLAKRPYQVYPRQDFGLLRTERRSGLLVTSPADTWLDLAATTPPARLEDVLDELLRRKLVTVNGIRRTIERRGARRSGVTAARLVLDGRDPADGVALSTWSRRVQRRMVAAGLPRPVTEYRVLDARGRLIAQVHLAYPDRRIAIELQSKRFHLTAAALERGAARIRSLQRAGWIVLPATWAQTMVEPDGFFADVMSLLE